jgi:hypothetical protein
MAVKSGMLHPPNPSPSRCTGAADRAGGAESGRASREARCAGREATGPARSNPPATPPATGTSARPRSTSSNPRRAGRSARSGDRSTRRGRSRACWASCRSSRSCRMSGTAVLVMLGIRHLVMHPLALGADVPDVRASGLCKVHCHRLAGQAVAVENRHRPTVAASTEKDHLPWPYMGPNSGMLPPQPARPPARLSELRVHRRGRSGGWRGA